MQRAITMAMFFSLKYFTLNFQQICFDCLLRMSAVSNNCQYTHVSGFKTFHIRRCGVKIRNCHQGSSYLMIYLILGLIVNYRRLILKPLHVSVGEHPLLRFYQFSLVQAIHGYRESQKENWSKPCMMIFKRMKDGSFESTHTLLPYVHVLDLDSKGWVRLSIFHKNHAHRFCTSAS